MKIALAFWGLTRSLSITINSIHKNVLDVLRENGVEYTIFLHTYILSEPYTNPRSKEFKCALDSEEYKLLKPDYFKIDNQDEVKSHLDLMKYRTHKDPWGSKYVTVDNYICAMYSKKQVTNLISESKLEFDCIIFLRPDVRYLNPLKIEWLRSVKNYNIFIPSFQLVKNTNDRFCITDYNNGILIGNMFDTMYDYSKINPLHSETFLYRYITYNLKAKIIYIAFYFNRVRANGLESSDVSADKLKKIGL